MRFERIDIASEEGATVISIEVVRGRHELERTREECKHLNVKVDEALADLFCRDCGLRVNPIAWVMNVRDAWDHVQRMIRAHRHESRRLDMRRWVVCQCGERIHLLGRPEDEKQRQATREGRYEAALERIALLLPGVAASKAPEIARAALAAADETAAGGPA